MNNLLPPICRRALTSDREMSGASGNERRLGWYAAGQHIALDVARGLHFLHKSGVRHADKQEHLRSGLDHV